MKPLRFLTASCLIGSVALASVAYAQRGGQRDPHVGYIYPAGGQQGTEVQVTIGGQYLDGATEAFVSGQGVQASELTHTKPLSNRQVNILRDKLDKARDKLKEMGKTADYRRRRGAFKELLEIAGVTQEEVEALETYRRNRSDTKRQLNPQIEETVTLTLAFDPDAKPGKRELRLNTKSGLSNPIYFYVGQFTEIMEVEPNDVTAAEAIEEPMPFVLNGQVMPGDVDRFRFPAKKGDRLVITAAARDLMPYLADAVPGWFQATLGLYDAAGREVAYVDDYQFHPDPIVYYRIPQDGFYDLEIKDSIYRGREDFVYRITAGEIPFLTSIFPLGGPRGKAATVEVAGWNLPTETVTVDAGNNDARRQPITIRNRKLISNTLEYVVDSFEECLEVEPNNDLQTAQKLRPPLIVNGRINEPGDWDVFAFDARKGGKIIFEVRARRLNTPVDSLLKLTDAEGNVLKINDDFVDKGAGLATHHADSLLHVTLPATGTYYAHLGDTQKKGGPAHSYRLRISARNPNFDLRIVPSTINARPNSTVPVTVYAMRRDGFEGDISIVLKGAPSGFKLSGGWVPADQEEVQLTLTVPSAARDEPYRLRLEGRGEYKGREIVRSVVPAEDMMQAFIYRHLVPAQDLMVLVSGRARYRSPVASGPGSSPEDLLKIPLGGTQRYQLALPNRRKVTGELKVELSNPPDGISILRTIQTEGGLVMLFSADAENAKAGLQGNLIVNAYTEREFSRPGSKTPTKRKIPIGKLPAIPFEVVGGR